eukprot:391077_1
MDSIDIIALALVIFRFVVEVPLMLYGLYLFDYHQHKQIILHRNRLLIHIIVILTILTQTIERTFLTSAFVWRIIDADESVVLLVLSIFWWALFGLFGVKCYNLYYQQQYNISIADEVWKREINPQTADWYIKNKHTWGSAIWVAKLCLIPYATSCVVESLFPRFFKLYGQPLDVFHSMLVFTPVTVAFIVVYKARKLSDVWRMRDETLSQSFLVLLVLVVYTFTFIFGYVPSLQQKYGEDFNRSKWTLYTFYADLIAILFAIYPTFYPVYFIKKYHIHSTQSLMQAHMKDGDINMSMCSMNLVMSKYHSFQLFMQHLVSEFAAENALFLVELIQIKQSYQKRKDFKVRIPKPDHFDERLLIDFNINPNNGEPHTSENDSYFTYLFNANGSIKFTISIPSKVPTSSIVTDHENDLAAQMSCLYTKYVGVDRLNISYDVHQKLDQIFAPQSGTNDDEDVLFNAMDECAVEVLMLLQQSFGRFISKDAFVPILQEIKTEMSGADYDYKMHSDCKMMEWLNSTSAGIITTEQMIKWHN